MTQATYLTFGLHGTLYAVDAAAVREILYLPELTPIEEAPVDIVGVFNLRGKVVPVMDLDIRFGRVPQRYCLTDTVVILERDGSPTGVIVNDVRDVWTIADEDIEATPTYGREDSHDSHFIASVAKVGEKLVMVLDIENLLTFSEDLGEIEPSEDGKALQLPVERSFFPNATPEEQTIFRQRAIEVMRSAEDQEEIVGSVPLAVVGLNGEYFGVDLHIVREFSDFRSVVPVPCCPERIVGNMNLRGDILTLVDIRGTLQMSMNGGQSASKVAVVEAGDTVVGVPVDEVYDVVYLRPSELAITPAAVKSIGEEYIKGTAPYAGRLLTVLDLGRLLTEGNIVVDQEA